MTTNSTNTTFELTKDSYVAFDAMSLRQLIVDKLNKQGTFTDQNVVGSNLAAVIDIVAYAYHTLIYYLNKTATESMFTEAQLFENINKIVKLIDYNPVGFQTSILSFECSAENLVPGLYTIPRYSYVVINNIPFSFNEDITFAKQTIEREELTDLATQKLLYQGIYKEYPVYTAAGEDNEVVIFNTNNELVDHFNIDVYVKSTRTNTWTQYTKTVNLFLEDGLAQKYEIRLNGDKNYEIKFGNDVNGARLLPGDQVAIYYLASRGPQGEIGPNTLSDQAKFTLFNTVLYQEILQDILQGRFRLLTPPQTSGLRFSNSTSSTEIKEIETTEQIRLNAPATYRSQYRLVTTSDYEIFVKTNFSNLIADVRVVNNWEYISGYLKYFYDIGIEDPSQTGRALLNQVQFADACNFNNVYLIVVPQSFSYDSLDYMVPSQKLLINSSIFATKMLTTETVFVDPVYKLASIGAATTTDFDPVVDSNACFLEIEKTSSTRRDNFSIINDVTNIFFNYFSRQNLTLGQKIDIQFLTQQILSVEGVRTIYTINRQTDYRVEGLYMFLWNPIYPSRDRRILSSNIQLQYFEYPLLVSGEDFSSKIIISGDQNTLSVVEY